jgi:hypothetical protein
VSIGDRFVRTWVVIGATLLAFVLCCAVPFVVNDADTADAILTNTVVALGGGAAIALMGGVLLAWVWADPHRHQALARGVEASATVREIVRTGWRGRAGRGGWSAKQGGRSRASNYQRHEYRIRLFVERSDAPPYEATVFETFEEGSFPKPGDRVRVKVHPQRPAIVVLAGN